MNSKKDAASSILFAIFNTDMKYILALLIIHTSLSLSAQTQTWQWVKAGGSSSDNTSVYPAECRIAGCDAKGNVYAVGNVNGAHMQFDTFSSAGAYSVNNVGISYLLFSYDCAGNMRWAKQIGDDEGNSNLFGVVTDPQGNTYFAGQFSYGTSNTNGSTLLYLGDTVISPPVYLDLPYLCMVKYDSLGKLVWFKNFQEDTAYSPHVGSFHNIPFGLRIGSSGNLWMGCYLDSNYAISPNLHTTLHGKYNVEVDPGTGNILGGYYTANQSFGDAYSADTYYDMDENENYYETGTLYGAGGDTLILANQTITPNPSQTPVLAYIYSLDKNGDFRYIITNKDYSYSATFASCKYDFGSERLVACWGLDSGAIYGTDTFDFNESTFNGSGSEGLFCIDHSGNILWGKYVTKTSNAYSGVIEYMPVSFYIDATPDNGVIIYNNIDTIYNNPSPSTTDYTKLISHIDENGNLIATHTAHEGNLGNLSGNNGIKYGATDWRGNVYLGGTVTNFFATPADSVVNTDQTSGNFLIAKLGISDCSCPSPDVQFIETSHGDTVFFYGSSINHSDSIQWKLGDSTFITADTFTHIYSRDTTYTVTAIAYSGCGIDSITRQVTVSCLLPGVQFTVTSHIDTAMFYGASTNSDSIVWNFGDGTSSYGDTVSHAYSQNGTYTVTATAYSPCGADSTSKQVVVTGLGIAIIDADKTNLYPNPTNSNINLSVSGPATIGLIYANGASVWSSPIQVSQQGTYVFDMNRYACAVYYFIVQYPNGKTDVLQAAKE
jgi:PKD repeat protein